VNVPRGGEWKQGRRAASHAGSRVPATPWLRRGVLQAASSERHVLAGCAPVRKSRCAVRGPASSSQRPSPAAEPATPPFGSQARHAVCTTPSRPSPPVSRACYALRVVPAFRTPYHARSRCRRPFDMQKSQPEPMLQSSRPPRFHASPVGRLFFERQRRAQRRAPRARGPPSSRCCYAVMRCRHFGRFKAMVMNAAPSPARVCRGGEGAADDGYRAI